MNDKNIKRIVFLGDLLRFDPNVSTGFTCDGYVYLVFHLFKEQIRLATGIVPEVAYALENKLFDNKKFYHLCGYDEPSFEAWLEIHSGKFTAAASDYLAQCFEGCLIIAQEAGALKQLFEINDIPFVEMFVSAIRFCEDNYFALRSNSPEITEMLKKYRLPEEHIFMQAAMVQAYYRRGKLNIEPDSLLICGQTAVDLSLLKNGRVVSFLDYQESIAELLAAYGKVYYKPHPYSPSYTANEHFIRNFSNVERTDSNFYRLMSTPNITAVAALSSGVLKEAPYFYKKIHVISHQYLNYWVGVGEVQKDDYITCTDEYFNPVFWADVLSPLVKTKECAHFNFNGRRNLLRTIGNTWWGYEIGKPAATHRLALIEEEIRKLKTPFRTLRRCIACLIPFKKLRRKIRGDHDEE